jgi:hypothetical protein
MVSVSVEKHEVSNELLNVISDGSKVAEDARSTGSLTPPQVTQLKSKLMELSAPGWSYDLAPFVVFVLVLLWLCRLWPPVPRLAKISLTFADALTKAMAGETDADSIVAAGWCLFLARGAALECQCLTDTLIPCRGAGS